MDLGCGWGIGPGLGKGGGGGGDGAGIIKWEGKVDFDRLRKGAN
jgi:hypothetical protein